MNFKRHEGHDHMSMAMSVASSTMDMVMASSTMDMAMGSSTMDMSSATNSLDLGMASMHMAGMSMNMFLTRAYKDYPVLFSSLSALNAGQAFGIFLLFFVVSFLSKGIEFFKNYLEQKIWNNPNYLVPKPTTVIECACDDDLEKGANENGEGTTSSGAPRGLPMAKSIVRDVIRLLLCFLLEMLGYAMMLVAMTFSLVYFFAVVTGMALGRFFFERLSDHMQLRPGNNNFAGHH